MTKDPTPRRRIGMTGVGLAALVIAWATVIIHAALVDIGDKDTIEDVPHTGEDNITSVRFARGEANGPKESLLVVAQRHLASPQSYYDAAPTTISYYRLVDASGEGVETTPFAFRLEKTVHPKQLYCNSDLALNKEAGLPLPATYDGPSNADGCLK